MITPMILGRDILTKANITLRFQNVTSTTSRVGETPNGVALVHTDWRALPSGWLQDEIVLSNNKLHIVTAKRDEVGGSSQRRFFVGVNPALIKPPSRAEQLGSLRLHKNLRNAGAEEIAAAERSFRRWREEGRLQHGCLGTESSTTSWYVTGGSGRRYRPVFTFLHLNRHLRAAFGNDPFAQVLISMLVDKTRCYKYTVVNDLADAYMHLWLLPSNWHLFTVNTTPFSETPTIEEFHCLPYGPSFCPRILETCLQWLLQHNKAQIDDCGYELWSYMDDIVIFSDKPVVEPEAQLQRLCEGYDLYLKATKRQDILHGDTLLLGQKYISDGDYLSLAEEKLNSFKLRGPSDNATFADLLGTLGSLSESPAIPPWSLALKHAAQALVSRERAAQHATWSSSCPKRLIELIRTWHGLVSETPIDEFKVPRLLDFDEPLHIFTDAARHAGGYIIRQSGQDLIQRVHIFSTRESSLPIVCLEGLVLYRAFSAVHRLELCGRRQFPRLYFHVDNTAVEVSFRAGRPAPSSSKDAKPILMKYLAMTNSLFAPQEFGRRILIERIDTKANPADLLTRHSLLQRFVDFAARESIELCSSSSEPPEPHAPLEFGGDLSSSQGVCVASIQVHGRPATLPNQDKIKIHQHSDSQIKKIMESVNDDAGPSEGLDRAYIVVWHTLLVRDGLLQRHVTPFSTSSLDEVVVVPVLPNSLVHEVIQYFHDHDGPAHPGIDRVLRSLKKLYWFPRMAKVVCEYVTRCAGCQEQQLRPTWCQAGVQKVCPPYPWHSVAADVLSVSTPSTKVLLLTAVCMFSQWPEVRILPSKSSADIAAALRSMNTHLGPFRVLRTDCGPESRGDVEVYLKEIGAKHSTSLPYSPVSVIEQLNRTILQKVQIAYNSPVWTRLTLIAIIDEILWSLRSTPSSVHQVEPYKLIFGRDPHHQRQLSVSERLVQTEHVSDVLGERRARALLNQPEPPRYEAGEIVFVKAHKCDRACKIGLKWMQMTVLHQRGWKLVLMTQSTNGPKIVERHTRECVRVPDALKSHMDRAQAPPQRHAKERAERAVGRGVGLPVQRELHGALNPDAQLAAPPQAQVQPPVADVEQVLRSPSPLRTRSGRRITAPRRFGFD